MAMRYNNILLIDDDADDQEIFYAALHTISDVVACIAISYAREALEKLRSKEITPDVIFLDLNMPIMTGQQFLLEIKKEEALKTIPVVIFSTTANQTTINLTLELGAHAFITKPTKFDELIQAIHSVIE